MRQMTDKVFVKRRKISKTTKLYGLCLTKTQCRNLLALLNHPNTPNIFEETTDSLKQQLREILKKRKDKEE